VFALGLPTSEQVPWWLFSVPLSPQSPIAEIFGQPGGGATGSWKLYRFEAAGQGFLEFGADAEFGPGLEPGEGYIYVSGAPFESGITGDPVPADDSFPIPLGTGWNLIGCPFRRPVSWERCRVTADGETVHVQEAGTRGWIRPALWRFTDGDFLYAFPDGEPESELRPGLGYWLYAQRACSLEVPRPH